MGEWGDIVRAEDAFGAGLGAVAGIGGSSTVIWVVDLFNDLIHEASLSDFSSVRSAASPDTGPFGIGGEEDVIWHCDTAASDPVFELDPTDFSVVQCASGPINKYTGIGGDSSVIWASSPLDNLLNKLDPSDLSIDTVYGSAPSGGIEGVGGNATVMWACDNGVESPGGLQERDVTGGSIVRTRAATDPPFYDDMFGIGGDNDVIWGYDDFNLEVQELDTGALETAELAVCISLENNYNPFFGGLAQNLEFCLKVDTWKQIIDTSADVLPTAGITGTAVSISMIKFEIEVSGVIVGPHAVHPIAARHNPDLQDMEELAILINREGLENKAVLTVSLPVGTAAVDRDYHGVVKAVTLEEEGGIVQPRFTLLFQVLWTVAKPIWRGWATAP